jgi:hypothetical protein
MSIYDMNSTALENVKYKYEGIYMFGGLNRQGMTLNKLLVLTMG